MQLIPGPTVGGHASFVQPPSFSPDGTRFAAGDLAGGLVVRERTGASPEAEFRVAAQVRVPAAGRYSNPQVRAVAWSPCGLFLATHEYGGVHVRHSHDLSEAAAAPHVGKGPIVLGGGGAWLAVLSESSVSILSIPALEHRGFHSLSRGAFEYFNVDTLAADPHGALVAAGDDGGSDETAMGMTLGRGKPQVTLMDAGRGAVIGAIEQGEHVRELAFDPWRRHLLTATYSDMGVWLPSGEPVRRFCPYKETYARAFAVTERWLVTSANGPVGSASLALWDAVTFEPLTRAPIPGGLPPDWIVASPDGRSLLTPQAGGQIRVWAVRD